MCANETAMHQPKAVHYMATVYTMNLFQRSFASLPRIKIPTVLLYFHSKNASFFFASFSAVSFSAGTYWNVSATLSGFLLYFIATLLHNKYFSLLLISWYFCHKIYKTF